MARYDYVSQICGTQSDFIFLDSKNVSVQLLNGIIKVV